MRRLMILSAFFGALGLHAQTNINGIPNQSIVPTAYQVTWSATDGTFTCNMLTARVCQVNDNGSSTPPGNIVVPTFINLPVGEHIKWVMHGKLRGFALPNYMWCPAGDEWVQCNFYGASINGFSVGSANSGYYTTTWYSPDGTNLYATPDTGFFQTVEAPHGNFSMVGVRDMQTPGNPGNLQLLYGTAVDLGVGGGGLIKQDGGGQIAVNNNFTNGTTTAGNIACITASNTVGNCGANPTNYIGVFKDTGGDVLMSGQPATVNLDASTANVAGQFVCTSSTAGLAHNNGSSTCPAGTDIGIVQATATAATASVILKFGSSGGSGGGGGGVADPGANGMVSRTALNTLTARTITGGSGVTVANGDGVAGAPLISLDTTVAVTQAQTQNLAPLVFNGTLVTSTYSGTMNPPPGGWLDTNNNPLALNFCPNATWTGGAVSINPGLGAKRVLVNGYDPPANTFLASSCYLLEYNPTLTVDGVGGVGALELKSLPGVSPYSFLPNAGATGTTLYKLTKLTGAPSTAVSAGTGDTGGMVGITIAGAGTTLTAVVQTSGNASCVFDGATTAGHYVQISSTVAGDCHDYGVSYPASGQVIGRVLATNGGAGTYPIQLFGAEVQAAAAGSGSGTVTSIGTTGPVSGGTITTSGTISCPTCVTGSSLTTGQLLKGAGSQGLQTADLTGDVTTAGGVATTIAANAVTSAKLAVVNARRTCSVVIGTDNGSALANADLGPQGRQCFVPAAATVVEITIAADGGVPSVLVRKNHGGTATNLTSAAFATVASGGLSCANTTGSGLSIDGATTCATALTATALAAGDWLELASGTADGTAKRMSITVTYAVN